VIGIAWLISVSCVIRTIIIVSWVARGSWKRGLHRELHGAPVVAAPLPESPGAAGS
jgi:hypothetical protein